MKFQTIKEILCIGSFLFVINLHAQVGVNTTTPHAQLEIKSSDASNPANTDGILIPKVDVFPAVNPTADQDGMMVYLTTDVGANLKGFYYWDNASASWKGIQGDKGWSLIGNAGTDVTTHFIGTTDNVGLKFKVNNTQAGFIDTVLYNTSFGQVAANAMTTGDRNVAFGTQSLFSNTEGYYNSAVGFQSMYSNTSGHDNSAFGALSLLLNTTGNRNSAFGMGTLNKNTTGNDNTAVGYFSMLGNTTGRENVAIGRNSLAANTTGNFNTAVGYLASQRNTIGQDNTSIGNFALESNETGNNNVAIGSGALMNNTESDNVAVGKDAMFSNTTGWSNSAFGSFSLNKNSTGYYNSAFGHGSLNKNTIGAENVAIGYSALYNNTTGYYNIAVGSTALVLNTTGTENTAIGFRSLLNNTTGNKNTAIGGESLYLNSTGSNNTALGSNCLYFNINGDNNVAVGSGALMNNNVANNVAVGKDALYSNTYGTLNSAFGKDALFSNTTGIRNSAFGNQSLYYNINGSANNAFGYGALYKNTTGTGNGGFGEEANPTTTTGWNNIGIGFHTLGQIDSGGNRIFGNEIGFDNIGIGLSAGDRSGNNINGCLFLGAFANVTFSNANLTNATAIGRYATVYQDNTIVLGAISGVNSAIYSTRVGIGTYNPICPLQVVGSTNQFGSWAFYARSGSTTTTGFANSTSGNFSIIASDRIQATEFNAVSDARIKNIQNRIDTAEALDKINQLQVTQYTYKDWLQKGTAPKTGFIAQEVEKIVPSAVNQTANYIPNIMQIPHAFCVDTLKNTISINLEKPIFLKKGDKIRLYNRATAVESEVNIIDAYNFECTIPNQLQTDDLFVYGTEVSDFRSVDYDQLHTLSVGAIQQLSKENKALEVRIQQLEALQTSIEQRIEKLEKLEQLKTLSASK